MLLEGIDWRRPKHARVALIARRNETVLELLNRFDEALEKFISKGIVTNEVVPELRRRGEL